MLRRELHNYTPAQVTEHLAAALDVLNAHELTADERARALPTVLQLLAEKQIILEQAGAVPNLALPGGPRH